MKLTETEIELLTKLAALGIEYVITVPAMGMCTLPVEYLVQFAENPDAYCANANGVSLEQYQAWTKYRKEYSRGQGQQCVAKTRAGRQCKNRADFVYSPKEYNYDNISYCKLHLKDVVKSEL